jgi:nucleoid-associated protein YgaU
MGLFDYVTDCGRKLFKKEEEAAPKIQEHIEQDNPGVKDLKVSYQDGVVSISGTAATPEAMEKAVLMAGNALGVVEVKADDLKIESSAPPPAVEHYVIQKGDNLSKIAKKYYSDPNLCPRIFEAYREVIKNPDPIVPGQQIRIYE